jgi:hypothetical protein
VQYYEKAKSIPWKTPPHCNATSSKFYSWHYTCWQVSFSMHLSHPNPPIGPPYGIARFITPNHISSCLLSSGIALYTT